MNKSLLSLILIITFLLLKVRLSADNENKIDSLHQVLATATSSDSLQILLDLADNYLYNKPEESIKYGTIALRLCEHTKNDSSFADCYSTLGKAFFYQDDYTNAVKYFEKQMEIYERINDKAGIANALNNLGVVYSYIDNYEKALDSYEKSIKLKKEIGDNEGLRSPLNNIGVIYEQKLFDYKKALEYYLASLEIERQVNDYEGIAVSITNIGDVYRKMQLFNSAISYYNESIEICNQYKYRLIRRDNYKGLYQAYSGLGQPAKALYHYEKYTELKDSIINEETLKQIAELEIQYESEKNERKIELLNKEKRLQSIVIYAFLLVIIIIAVFSFLLYRQFAQKKKANILLAKQKQNITDSINYASRIQSAVQPSAEAFLPYFSDFFIIWKPKDIVSGDFYWFRAIDPEQANKQIELSELPDNNKKSNLKLVIAAADCTGHGVPGAFVSILGISLLNEIVQKIDNWNDDKIAGYILENLRIRVKKALRQTGKHNESKDGMDIALCVIDQADLSLQFAGAFNSLFICRRESAAYIFHHLKGTKNPIGIYLKERPFETQTFQLKSDDRLYLFTDGLIDQQGGKQGRKFLIRKLKDLLTSVQQKPMTEQKYMIENHLNAWMQPEDSKTTYEQVDDMLLIGIKI